jgi:hypothetical protein
MVNVERTCELAAFLRANPDKHNQETWLKSTLPTENSSRDVPAGELRTHCGTTGCAAGWAILLFDEPNAPLRVYFDGAVSITDRVPAGFTGRAAELLDLPMMIADLLFYSSKDDLLVRLDHLADHPDATLDELIVIKR